MAEQYDVRFQIIEDATRTANRMGDGTLIGGRDPETRRNEEQANKTRQRTLLSLIGVQFTLAALLKNSQIFTNTTGALFQILGGFIDLTLAPLMPLFAQFLSYMAGQFPAYNRMIAAVAPRVVDIITSIGRGIGRIYASVAAIGAPVFSLFDKDGVSADGRLSLNDIIQGLGAAVLGQGIFVALQTGSTSIVSATVRGLMGATIARLSGVLRGTALFAAIIGGINFFSTLKEEGIIDALRVLADTVVSTIAAAIGAMIGSAVLGIPGMILGAMGGAFLAQKFIMPMIPGMGAPTSMEGGSGVIGRSVASDFANTQSPYVSSDSAGFIGSSESDAYGYDREIARLGGR
jgi:hypothetical protein